MQTGENQEALRRIFDLLRFGSILVLLVHFYSVGYETFRSHHLTFAIVDRIIYNLSNSFSILQGIHKPKLAALLLLAVSLLGSKGKKDENLSIKPVLCYILIGLLLYFISFILLSFTQLYIVVTVTGYLLILAGGSKLSRLVFLNLNRDIFNDLNETFPQEERLLTNEYSINLPS